MKFFLSCLSLVLFVNLTNAQVGIDTNDPKTTFHIVGSATDNAAADGILLPALSIAQLEAKMGASTYGPDQDGAIVYVDDVSASSTIPETSGITKKGIYYFEHNGASGRWLTVGESKLWSTTGNASTDETTDFIGTKDAQALVFKVNDTFAGRISDGPDGSLFLGYEAGLSDDLTLNLNTFVGYQAGKFTTSGFNNTAIGSLALSSNTTGTNNIAIGSGALLDNNGSLNVAIGNSALNKNTTGGGNIAIGVDALNTNEIGSLNLAIGHEALYSNLNGFRNVALGDAALYANVGGEDNTAIGYRALQNSTTGIQNTAIGAYALLGNSIGGFNSATGYRALYSNTEGNYNSAYGQGSLSSNTLGNYNSAFGAGSLVSNVDGNANTAIGLNALTGNIDGDNNTGSGYRALFTNSTGNNNTANGYEALFNNTTGENNVAVGSWALYTNIANSRSTALGYRSMFYADDRTTGRETYNTAVGYEALRGSTTAADNTGRHNTAIGDQALLANTSGNDNVALGAEALSNNTTGGRNTAVGYQALMQSNTTGNTAFGWRALSNTTAGNNTALGNSAMSQNTTGSSNVAVGIAALGNNSTGNRNTVVGSGAFSVNPDGSDNTILGYNSLYLITSGDYNVTLGSETGRGDMESNRNTYIGYQAGYGTTTSLTREGNVFLGYQAGYYEDGNNRLYIENSDTTEPLIYGEFDNDVLRINGSLQVGEPGFFPNDGYAFPDIDGNPFEIMVTDGDGELSWVSPSIFNTVQEGSNGLNRNILTDDIQLGGALTQSTEITLGSYNLDINLNEFGDFAIQDGGVDHFHVGSNGFTYFGDNSQWRDGDALSGTLFAQIFDDGDDGRLILYENGNIQIDLDANGTSVFNQEGLNRDFRVESDDEINMFFLDAGNNRLGIREGNPGTDIHLKQSSNTQSGSGGMMFENSSSTDQWKIYHSGTHFSFAKNSTRLAYISGLNGDYVQTSDRRLKKNIVMLEPVLKSITNLNFYRYHYKHQLSTERKMIGVMAQDIEKTFPELVSQDEKGLLGVSYNGLSVVALQAIKEQQTQIETQNTLIETQNQKLEDQDKEIKELKTLVARQQDLILEQNKKAKSRDKDIAELKDMIKQQQKQIDALANKLEN